MIYRSPYPDVDVPDVTLVEHVLGPGHGDRTALVDGVTGERLTYAQLAEEVSAAAASLAALGVGVGDVVAVLSHNQPRYAVAVYAALSVGAAVAPANPALTTGELAEQFDAAKAGVLIHSAACAEKAAAVDVEHRFVLEERLPPGEGRWVTLASAGDPAAIPFSSGTTGLPKGVVLTHRNLVANLEQNSGWRLGPDDVLAAALPFFHIYGFMIILAAGLRAGATIVTLPRYSLPGYLGVVQEYGVTRAFLAPPMVLGIANSPEAAGYDLSSLRYALSGAAPLDVEVAERAEARLGCLIRQGYGMTEASPGTHQVRDEEFATTPAGSVGRLIASTEARLVDPATGADANPGELWVRGPQVMAGYLDDPAATAATIVEDGWLRTGDIVRVDDDGIWWVVDRLKELIKYKGYQVAPAELEAVLLTHPSVLDAAVVGVPHAEGGEAPKAFVVPDGALDADELMAWVAERVAPYKKVRAVEFIAEIPKSPSGKILRRLLAR